MKVAVLMSTYNGEKYLREQIESILKQKGSVNISLFVRDDGSSDNTIDILNEYQSKGKLKWYTGENCGPAKSFIDLVFRYPGYDYYSFSDQDDYWLEDKIADAVKAIEQENSPALYFSNTEQVDYDLKSLGVKSYKESVPCDFYSAMIYPHFIGCTMVFNSHLAQIIQKSEVPGVMLMHDSFLARVCVAVGGKMFYDSKVHMKYRQHANNVIGSSVGWRDAIKRRIQLVTTTPKIDICSQLQELLKLYGYRIDDEKEKWIRGVIDYKGCFIKRVRLALSNKMQFDSRNMALTIKLRILFGNL